MSYVLKKTRNKNKPNKCNSIFHNSFIFSEAKFKQKIQVWKEAAQKFIKYLRNSQGAAKYSNMDFLFEYLFSV